MILYSDNEMIVPERKILLPQDRYQNIITERKIILPKDVEKEHNRRQFLLLSLACMGTMVFPTNSKANPIFAGLGLAYSIFQVYVYGKKAIKYGKELIQAYHKTKNLRYIGNANIPHIGVAEHSSYSKSQSSRVAEKLAGITGLNINSNGIYNALQYIPEKPIFWDREGYANSQGEIYMNRAVVHLKNKTNKKITKKIQLVLVDQWGKAKDIKHFTAVANPYKSGTFNLSEYFRELSSTGFRNIEFAVQGNSSDIQINSENNKIVVSKFLA